MGTYLGRPLRTNTTANTYYTDTITWGDCGSGDCWPPIPYSPPPTVTIGGINSLDTDKLANEITKRLAKASEETKGREPMRGLFEVFVVDPKTGDIVFEKRLVADDEAKARLKAAVQAKLDRDVDEYDIIVRKIGDVRQKKTVQEVKVVS